MRSKAVSAGPYGRRRLLYIDVSSDPPASNRQFRLEQGPERFLPLIGATSQIIRSSKWYKEASGLGVEALEINRRNSKLYFSSYFLEKVKRYLQGIHLSLHSATTGVFQEVESFTQAELATLRAEIDVASYLDAREVVFHLNSEALTRHGNKERLARIIDYAKARHVDMLYESSSVLQGD